MKCNIPIEQFEDLIAHGLWVGHKFEYHGKQLVVASIGQAEFTAGGERVIPIDLQENEKISNRGTGPRKRRR